ncbi:MAG: cysteine hydrolase [Clostridiales Family XIII bacterium]|jgi:nicotinamidase-related amidase|nr:cysteine hydrolase [Clostridiales Family XIII bacterium]
MRKYLIVVDMQNDFIDGTLGTAEARAVVPAVAAKIRAHLDAGLGPAIFTLDTHAADYLETAEGQKLPVAHCLEGSEGWRLHPEIEALAKASGGLRIRKPTFGSAALGEHLRQAHEKEPISCVELVGLCTDICVISNALLVKAFLPEVPVLVDSACCAGVTPESHENALASMRACQVDVL